MSQKKGKVNSIQKLSQDYEMINISWHEAAHIIVGLLFHLKIDKAFASLTTKRAEGETSYAIFDQEVTDDDINNYLIMSEIYMNYAGMTAEKILYKEMSGSDRFPMVLREGSSQDILTAADLIAKNNLAPPGKPRQEFKRKIIKDLTRILKEYWDDMRLVAHILYKKKKITDEDLTILLTKKSKRKKFWKERLKNIEFLVESIDPLDEDEIKDILASNYCKK